jgi:hypothetical protein
VPVLSVADGTGRRAAARRRKQCEPRRGQVVSAFILISISNPTIITTPAITTATVAVISVTIAIAATISCC